MGHRLDREVERNFIAAKALELENTDITKYIEEHVKMSNVLKTTMTDFDGDLWFVALQVVVRCFPCAILGAFGLHFIIRMMKSLSQPVNVRYCKPLFDLECDDIQELKPGEALLVRRNGECTLEQILEQRGDSKCSFERIYFSRGSDRDIYKGT